MRVKKLSGFEYQTLKFLTTYSPELVVRMLEGRFHVPLTVTRLQRGIRPWTRASERSWCRRHPRWPVRQHWNEQPQTRRAHQRWSSCRACARSSPRCREEPWALLRQGESASDPCQPCWDNRARATKDDRSSWRGYDSPNWSNSDEPEPCEHQRRPSCQASRRRRPLPYQLPRTEYQSASTPYDQRSLLQRHYGLRVQESPPAWNLLFSYV